MMCEEASVLLSRGTLSGLGPTSMTDGHSAVEGRPGTRGHMANRWICRMRIFQFLFASFLPVVAVLMRHPNRRQPEPGLLTSELFRQRSSITSRKAAC